MNSGDANSLSLRFEDLVRDPHDVMRWLCSEIDVDFDPVLLEPTLGGEPVAANTSFERSSGIDAAAADSWRSHLSTSAGKEIEDRLGPLMQRLGYQ